MATQTITITLDPAVWQEFVSTRAAELRYAAVVPDPAKQGGTMPNPKSAEQTVLDSLAAMMRSKVRQNRVNAAAKGIDTALAQTPITVSVSPPA